MNRFTSIFFIALFIVPFIGQGQATRYLDDVFPQIKKTEDVYFSSNTTIGGQVEDLYLDVYEPVGDTLQHRPLIIFAHAGFFDSGDKDNDESVFLAETFAKKGYVTASIQYRLFDAFIIPDTFITPGVLFRARADMMAAIRFFRKDAATTNLFKILPNRIIAGGVSAGAMVALHAGFLDNENEVTGYYLDSLKGNGGIEGNGGNDGYSSKVSAVINLDGAIIDTSIMDADDPIVVSVASENDTIIPYGHDSAFAYLFGNKYYVATLDGSSIIHKKADEIGIKNDLLTIKGGYHGQSLIDPVQRQATVNFVSNFLYQNLELPTVSIKEVKAYSNKFSQFPNPVTDHLTIKQLHSNKNLLFTISDLAGRQLISQKSSGPITTINTGNLSSGIYLVTIQDNGKTVYRSKFSKMGY